MVRTNDPSQCRLINNILSRLVSASRYVNFPFLINKFKQVREILGNSISDVSACGRVVPLLPSVSSPLIINSFSTNFLFILLQVVVE